MADAPALRAIFLRSEYPPATLAAALGLIEAAIRAEGLRPDIVGSKDEVRVYGRPARKASPTVEAR